MAEIECPGERLEEILHNLNPMLFGREYRMRSIPRAEKRFPDDIDLADEENRIIARKLLLEAMKAEDPCNSGIMDELARSFGYINLGKMIIGEGKEKAREMLVSLIASHVKEHKQCKDKYALFIGDFVIAAYDKASSSRVDFLARRREIDKLYLGICKQAA